ncbi:Ig-like domain-containing protein, partial [Rubrolithibacter danxiaensis]|uniref:Ig-like domain-containing protein n=1 Tax=Rubrolithibacter danxiaensis TaxID=3390805 RepID=UPI003BF776C7
LPANGTLMLNGAPVTSGLEILSSAISQLSFIPNPDWNGSASFNWNGQDGTDYAAADATVTITIAPVNDIPVANDDEFYMEQDTKLSGECGCSNDSDPDGDKLMFTKLTEPANGAASISTTGKLAYTPNSGYVGLDNFTYQACDASGACDIARITINVLPTTIVNLTPEFSNVTEGKKISVTASLVRPFPEDVTILLDYEGTASLKQDYLLRDQYQTIIIPKGSLSSTDKVTIHALTDAAKEGDETINITIATVSNERVKIGKEAKVNIQDGVLDSTAIEKPVPENPDIKPDPLVSPNDDGIKDFFYIENILSFNSNEVIIYNRQGNEVFRMKGYNETDRVFRGYANTGLLTNTNTTLVDGVYYYLIYTHRLIDGKEVTLLNKGYLIMKKQ